MFDTATYRRRRSALVKELATRGEERGLALFIGNGESPMNYADNTYPFRQDSSFLYFFGIRKPGLAATIDLETGTATVYGDDLSMDDIVWTGPEPKVTELADAAGAEASRPRADLVAAAERSGRLLWVPPYRDETRRELAALAAVPIDEIDALSSTPLIRSVLALREIKEEAEIAELEAAVATSVDMHRAAIAMARPGLRESDIAARVTEVALADGGGLSFPVIATVRGATLHNHRHDGLLEAGQLFLLDAGAETPSGYAGDLTSTFPVAPAYDARQKAIYEIVLAMGRAAASRVKPGVPYAEAHDAAAEAGVRGLSALGLMKGDPAEAVARGAHALFFPHGVGHMVGLDVHDMENYGERWVGYDGAARSDQFGRKSLRLAKPLKAGMVLTIEPGIYFIPELIAAWKAEGRFAECIDYKAAEAYLGFGGIRNEEDWLVTPTGGCRLGPDFDKSVAAMEAARRRGGA